MNKPRSSFTTPKGTVLPLLNLKNKEYLQVAHRLVWLAEEHENYEISTQFLEMTEEVATVKATITIFGTSPQGQSIVIRRVNGTKTEHKAHFMDFKEKAETSAIGRALALIGIGTQFCTQDLDEGDRIVDSPVIAASKPKVSSFMKPKDNGGLDGF